MIILDYDKFSKKYISVFSKILRINEIRDDNEFKILENFSNHDLKKALVQLEII